jgi:hypothetical protein
MVEGSGEDRADLGPAVGVHGPCPGMRGRSPRLGLSVGSVVAAGIPSSRRPSAEIPSRGRRHGAGRRGPGPVGWVSCLTPPWRDERGPVGDRAPPGLARRRPWRAGPSDPVGP